MGPIHKPAKSLLQHPQPVHWRSDLVAQPYRSPSWRISFLRTKLLDLGLLSLNFETVIGALECIEFWKNLDEVASLEGTVGVGRSRFRPLDRCSRRFRRHEVWL